MGAGALNQAGSKNKDFAGITFDDLAFVWIRVFHHDRNVGRILAHIGAGCTKFTHGIYSFMEVRYVTHLI